MLPDAYVHCWALGVLDISRPPSACWAALTWQWRDQLLASAVRAVAGSEAGWGQRWVAAGLVTCRGG